MLNWNHVICRLSGTHRATLTTLSDRPRSVTFLLWGVFLLGIWNALRAYVLSEQSALLRDAGVQPDPAWRISISLVWAALFILLGVALWLRKPGARPGLMVCAAIYGVYNLLLAVFIAQAPATRQSWPAGLALSVILLLYIAWALYRPANRRYWQSQDVAFDQPPENR